jgi:hypothetical protein
MIHSLGAEANRICSTIRGRGTFHNLDLRHPLIRLHRCLYHQHRSSLYLLPNATKLVEMMKIPQLCWKCLLGCQCYDIFIALDLRICILAAYVHRQDHCHTHLSGKSLDFSRMRKHYLLSLLILQLLQSWACFGIHTYVIMIDNSFM